MRMVARAQMLGLAAVVLLLMSACQTMTGETAGQYVDDSAITTAVKAKLAGDHAASLTRIGVETDRGVVTLTGVAKDEATKQRAAELASSVKGVQGVNNNVQVQAQPPAAGGPQG